MQFIDLFQKSFIVGCGGFLGAIFRFFLNNKINDILKVNLPISTLIINLSGAFFIGMIASLFESMQESYSNIHLFLMSGFLASFTTFSTLSLEALVLLRNSQFFYFFSL